MVCTLRDSRAREALLTGDQAYTPLIGTGPT